MGSGDGVGGLTGASNTRPFLIAEAGVNHEGSLGTAHEMIHAAADSGVDAIKFQTYTADLLASQDSPPYWDISEEPAASQHELFSRFRPFLDAEYVELRQSCDEVGIEFMTTFFDTDSVKRLGHLVNIHKVSSSDITNIPLLKAVGAWCKPVLLSTGASNCQEIARAVDVLETAGASEVILLHCVLSYPTADDQAQLGMIQGLQTAFPNHRVGYSDHTTSEACPTVHVLAFAKGAVAIETHFTLDKTAKGNDHYHSLDANDLADLVHELNRAQKFLGGHGSAKQPTQAEAEARRQARRGIALRTSVSAGQVLNEQNLITLRPERGIPAYCWDQVVGASAARSLKKGSFLEWEDITTE